MDTTGLTWYTEAMKRGPKPKPVEEHMLNVGLKVPPEIKTELLDMVNVTGVAEGTLARLLFMRGLLAFRVDRSLNGSAPIQKLKGRKRGRRKPIDTDPEDNADENKKGATGTDD